MTLVAFLLAQGGLAVHVGSTDGAAEIRLAEGGRRLVHGLATGDPTPARAAILRAGLYGVASVEAWSGGRLPYADNLASLLVADLETLGPAAPSEEEIDRVLAPGGTAELRRHGAWTRTSKARPADVDDWTHFDRGPDGNGVSRDRRVRRPEFVQWMSNVQDIKLGGNPAGFVGLSGVRVAENRAVFDYVAGKSHRLACRDAWSGLPLWTLERDAEAGRRRWQLVAANGLVYSWTKRDGPLVALDAPSGREVLKFDTGARLPDEGTQLRVGREVLLVNTAAGLEAFHPTSGAPLWKKPGFLLFPCLVEEAGRAFAAVAKPESRLRSRWPWAETEAVVALDLRDGREAWRCELGGKPVGQLVHRDGLLALFCGSAIGGRGDKEGGGWVSAVDAASGKRLGEGTFRVAWNDSMYNALVRDGAIWYAGHTSVYRFDPAGAGAITRPFNVAYNQRCNRFTATETLWLTGYVTYLDRDFNGALQSAGRAGCALGTTPANGMVYFTPSACRCFTQMRGYLAMAPDVVRPADPRLEKPAAAALPEPGGRPAGPLIDEWTGPSELTGAGDVVAVTQEHRVEARRDGRVLWRFLADGRVSHAPLVRDGRAFFGSHDGWVYAVDVETGRPAWRAQVAPYARKIVAYGQLESSWPVYGLAELDGLLWASAGHHPELGGGVRVAGLDPATGEAKVRRVLAKSPAAITTSNGKAAGAIVPHSFLNEAPAVENGLLKIGAFVFDPRESDEELRRRLETPPAKK